MYNSQFNNMFGNSTPTATQPYGYPLSGNNYYNQPQQFQAPQTNTNKIFVSGIEEVRARMLPPNSDYLYLDNDKAILYQKVVDSKGQFQVKEFTITPKEPDMNMSNEKSMNLSDYVKRDEFDKISNELKTLKEEISKLGKVESENGRAREESL